MDHAENSPQATANKKQQQAATQLLFVDDEIDFLTTIQMLFRNTPSIELFTAHSSEEALSTLEAQRIDVLITDQNMPGENGESLLKKVKELYPETVCAMLSAYMNLDLVIELINSTSAVRVIQKPVDQQGLISTVDELIEIARLRRKEPAEAPVPAVWDEGLQFHFDLFVGESPAMHRLYRQILKIAPTSAPVLIQGETGTGKELVAHAIYHRSNRSDMTFTAVNCGAIQESLIDSHLFGHEKGSFTGAVDTAKGVFEASDGGTVFLDEVAELTPAMQTRLLRFLQEGTYSRVGSTVTRSADVRIIAASNIDLWKAVEERRFRADLYFRLQVFTLFVPPLRERGDDFSLLISMFLLKLAKKNNGLTRSISPVSLEKLKRSSNGWPGNIRQLQNIVEKAYYLSDSDVIDTENLFDPEETTRGYRVPLGYEDTSGNPEAERIGGGEKASEAEFSDTVELSMREVEKRHIQHILEITGLNKARAAEILGITRSTLYKKMRDYGLD
ncbi:MAG: sigma-54 dependent transcriptional regulator [Spirochaetaceae bacterium]|nr:sigma-54 dependent transcriptional regulator [Spirochaetaceae bacterium]MCF7947166.1 sigma-54 dependent transcriptional regulator [Spirochaetia bacterium]MCF7950031.1 sigma-54 dependent transcriptional regulator [Spirochaetaceae bacterium]